MSINIYQRDVHTLGDMLMLVSFFNSLNEPVVLYTNQNSWYSFWKRTLDIGSQITIIEKPSQNDWPAEKNHPEWNCGFKIFSRYVQPEHVYLWGQKFLTGRRNKKCAAIVLDNGYHTKDQIFWDNVDRAHDLTNAPEYPYLKFIPKNTYNVINDLAMSAGYDTIILDSKEISAEQKVFVLNEMCDFVIGYEGGVAHLAHVLKIPAIIFPWRKSDDGSLSESWLHLDKKTYFVKQPDEIYSWTSNHLVNIVENLHNDLGNNQWLTASTFPDTGPLLEFIKGSPQVFHDQVNWAKNHIAHITLGGF